MCQDRLADGCRWTQVKKYTSAILDIRVRIFPYGGTFVLSRLSVLKGAVVSLGAPMINRGRFSLFAQSGSAYCTRTVDLVRQSMVIDMLGLLTLNYREFSSWEKDPSRFRP